MGIKDYQAQNSRHFEPIYTESNRIIDYLRTNSD